MKPTNERLDPQLSAQLKTLKDIPERDPQAATRGRMKFLQEAASMSPTVIMGRVKQDTSKKPSFFASVLASRPARLATRLVIIAALAVGLLGAGGAAAVYASRDSMPGDTLYPVKIWGEDLQLTFASTPQAELNLNLQYAERRMAEIGTVLDKDEELAAHAMLRLQGHIQGAMLAAGQVNGEQAVTAMESVRQTLQHQQRFMQQLGENTDAASQSDLSQTREMFQEQMRIVENQLLEEEMQLKGERDGQQQLQPGGAGSGQGTQEGQHPGQPNHQGEAGQQQKGKDGMMQQTSPPENTAFTPTPTPTLFPQGGSMQPGGGNNQSGGEVTPMPNEPQPGLKK